MLVSRKMLPKILTLAASLSLPAWSLADDGPASVFDQLDTNKDGVVTLEEVPEDKRRLFEKILKSGDKDKDGKLTREEFAAARLCAATACHVKVGPAMAFRPAVKVVRRFAQKPHPRPVLIRLRSCNDWIQTATERSAKTKPKAPFKNTLPAWMPTAMVSSTPRNCVKVLRKWRRARGGAPRRPPSDWSPCCRRPSSWSKESNR